MRTVDQNFFRWHYPMTQLKIQNSLVGKEIVTFFLLSIFIDMDVPPRRIWHITLPVGVYDFAVKKIVTYMNMLLNIKTLYHMK